MNALFTLAIGLFVSTSSFAKSSNTVTIGLGEEQVLTNNNISLTLTKIEDSRCPRDVECIWEGDVKAQVEVSKDNNLIGHFQFSLVNDQGEAVEIMPGVSTKLVQAMPYPQGVGEEAQEVTLNITETRMTSCEPLRRVFCTREYNPTSCKAKGVIAQGTNPCTAKAELQLNLCMPGKTVAPSKISCEGSKF